LAALGARGARACSRAARVASHGAHRALGLLVRGMGRERMATRELRRWHEGGGARLHRRRDAPPLRTARAAQVAGAAEHLEPGVVLDAAMRERSAAVRPSDAVD